MENTKETEITEVEKPKMKNLANCNPREFLLQTNKIRKAVKNWMEVTRISEIRKQRPELLPIPEFGENPTEKEMEELAEIRKKNRNALREQSRQNIMDMFEAALETNVDATLEVLCHVSFIDPADVEKYKTSDLIGSFNEIINCQEVLDFFTLLMNLGLMNTSGIAKA